MDFKLVSDYAPMGDQPEAIAQLVGSIRHGSKHNTLLGVTGSGKTFTVANVIAQLNRPTLVLSHNKTLAAQLYGEFRNFFPENAVEYFVSYYDYYQPEAYLPSTDTFIEKDLSINAEIEKLRLRTVATLLSGRRDVVVVSSVSCLYGAGNPADFHATAINIRVGQVVSYKHFLYKLVEALYTRTERDLEPATFRVNGDTVDIMAAFGEFGSQCFRVMFYDNEVEAIQTIDPATGQRIHSLDNLTLYPTSLFVTTKERINCAVQQIYLDLGRQIEFFERAGRTTEAQRIKQRVEYDVEMIKELGYCPGIENYSRYFDGRAEGTRPFCLIDYFPKDYMLVVDESHVTLPQVHAMYGGDRARKENLVEYGFRLPAAKDNRPVTFAEFEQLQGTSIYVSATPADYELMKSEGVIVEQLIRPTGLVDPPLEVRVRDKRQRYLLVAQRAVQAMRAALSDELRDALDACKINNSQENYQRLTATLAAAPLYFPAQRPDGAAAEADGQQHLQFGKVRTNDGRTFFCAFTDRARLVRWRNMGSVELGVKDYTSLVLSSNDTGIIIDPGVGSGLALTREMLQTLQAQTEFIDQMRAAATELGLDFDADTISEAARNINVDEPEKTGRKERRWFGKKKK